MNDEHRKNRPIYDQLWRVINHVIDTKKHKFKTMPGVMVKDINAVDMIGTGVSFNLACYVKYIFMVQLNKLSLDTLWQFVKF